MPHQYSYKQSHADRQKAPKDNNSITVEGNVVDLTGDKMPKIPPAPRSPIPQDDAFHKERVETT